MVEEEVWHVALEDDDLDVNIVLEVCHDLVKPNSGLGGHDVGWRIVEGDRRDLRAGTIKDDSPGRAHDVLHLSG
ncbi:hypothetical protein J7I92_20240 [Arthrobacter sp. ISL-72]|nr:hypothetical protein [Arthrobacter sp. ISL-72]